LKEVWRKLFTKSFLQVFVLNKSTFNGDIAKVFGKFETLFTKRVSRKRLCSFLTGHY